MTEFIWTSSMTTNGAIIYLYLLSTPFFKHGGANADTWWLQVTREREREREIQTRRVEQNAHSPIDRSFCRASLLLTYALQPLLSTTLFSLLFSAMGANVFHSFLSFSDLSLFMSKIHICSRMGEGRERWGGGAPADDTTAPVTP